MKRQMIRNSLSKNRLVSAFMAGFLALASALFGAALVLALGVAGSVEGFMERAHTPHFMQMHQGELDYERLNGWAAEQPAVVAWEAIPYLNVENSQLRFGASTLEAEIQQNGFVTQPQHMDFLLGEDGEPVTPRPGEVYVPYFYEAKYRLGVGDTVTVFAGADAGSDSQTVLTVAGAFRDSQMNSTLASSKRLVVHADDYQALAAQVNTAPEHLISFRLQEPSAAAGFEADYFAASLENDGPSLTWSMFRLINSLNDGLTALLFVLMSVVVLLITFLCIRYTLLATLEEDLGEIGVMKALGVNDRHISSIYLGKYRLLLGAGAAFGLLTALLARPAILANVQRSMGEVGAPLLGVLAALAGVALLFGAAMLFVRRVLRRLRTLTPLQALRQEGAAVTSRARPRPMLAPTTGVRVNAKLAWANMRGAPAAHLTILAVALLTTLALLVPFRFGSTARSAEFVTYMGIGQYDLRIDLIGHPDALGASAAISTALSNDPRVERLELYVQEVETALDPEGRTAPIRVDYGDHSAFPLRYAAGRAPETPTEISLSEQNAERFGVAVGATLEVVSGQNGNGTGGHVRVAGAADTAGLTNRTPRATTFTVTGIYQDVTNGGKTAKALPGPTMDAAQPGAMIAVSLAPGADASAMAAAVTSAAAGAQVIDTGTFVQQMLGDLIRVMDGVAWVFAGVAVLLAWLMAGLGVRLILVRERKPNAVMQALGFTRADLRQQYLLRVLIPLGIGVAVGLVLATPVGNLMGNLVFATVGVSGLSLAFAPISTLLGSALVITAAAVATLTTLASTAADSQRRLVARLQA